MVMEKYTIKIIYKKKRNPHSEFKKSNETNLIIMKNSLAPCHT